MHGKRQSFYFCCCCLRKEKFRARTNVVVCFFLSHCAARPENATASAVQLPRRTHILGFVSFCLAGPARIRICPSTESAESSSFFPLPVGLFAPCGGGPRRDRTVSRPTAGGTDYLHPGFALFLCLSLSSICLDRGVAMECCLGIREIQICRTD